MLCRLLCLVSFMGLALVSITHADESDQYMVWGIELADAAPTINAYVNERIVGSLGRINESNPDCDCETLTTGVFTDIYQDRLRANLTDFIEFTQSIEVYPARDVIPGEIIDQSIYRNALVSITIRVTRNIRIGEVYLGTDKLNHFFGIGRRYYTRYLASLKAGRSQAEAEDEAILWGILTENTFLGSSTNGIFSIADLESNYQGFRLAQGLCAGDSPYIVHQQGKWTIFRPIDLRDYVDPTFDESFNPSLYAGLLRGAVLKVVEEIHAPKAGFPALAARFNAYRSTLPPSSRSLALIRRHLEENAIPAQRPSLMKALGISDSDPAAPMDVLKPE